MKRLLVFAALCLCLGFAFWLFLSFSSWRIKRVIGLSDSKFAVFHGRSVSIYDAGTDVAVSYLSLRDKERLMSRFNWTPVENQPWYDGLKPNGSSGTYGGIPWFRDLAISRIFAPVLSAAPPIVSDEDRFICAHLSTKLYRYDLVFQERRNLLWIVSRKRDPR